LIEIKSPMHGLYHAIPPQYMAQVQGQLECCGRDWAHFVVFYAPDADHELLAVWKVPRSEAYWVRPSLEPWTIDLMHLRPPSRSRCVKIRSRQAWLEPRLTEFYTCTLTLEPPSLTYPPLDPPPDVPVTEIFRGLVPTERDMAPVMAFPWRLF